MIDVQVHHDLRQRHPDHHRLGLEGVDRAAADQRRPLELLLRLSRHRKSSRLDWNAQVPDPNPQGYSFRR